MPSKNLHTPVMLEEVTKLLSPSPGKLYLDATVGAGGHARALLEKGARVIGIDRDKEILAKTASLLQHFVQNGSLTLKHLSFSQLSSLEVKVDGILFDLGVSSFQLDTPERGFSFRYEAPLDMRMDVTLPVTAKDLVNGLNKQELIKLFTLYGEEKAAKKIADLIVKTRENKPLTTTKELSQLVTKAKGGRKGARIHPATKVFQALRIAVNDELNELKAALPSALSMLLPQGVCVVISFHSLEDRVVKNTFKKYANTSTFSLLTNKPLTSTPKELNSNPRSRSAKLRAIRRNI